MIDWTTDWDSKQPESRFGSGWKGYHNHRRGKHIIELRNHDHGCNILVHISRERRTSPRRLTKHPTLPSWTYETEIQIKISQNGKSRWHVDSIHEMRNVLAEAVYEFNLHSKIYELDNRDTLENMIKVAKKYASK